MNKKYRFPIILMMHNASTYFHILTKVFENIKIINTYSHPINLIYSWYQKGYGKLKTFEENISPTASPCINFNNKILPIFALGSENTFSKIGEFDRIILMINLLLNLEKKSYDQVTDLNKSKIKFINYENLVLRPEETIKDIFSFFEKKYKKEQIGEFNFNLNDRRQSINEISNKKSKIFSQISTDSKEIINSMLEDFETHAKG